MAQLTAIEIERENRISKAQVLREKQQNPYTEKVARDITLLELKNQFDNRKG